MKKLNKVREIFDFKNGHLMAKFYLRMGQEMQACFMINLDQTGNGQGLHYGKRNTFIFLFIFGFMQGRV